MKRFSWHGGDNNAENVFPGKESSKLFDQLQDNDTMGSSTVLENKEESATEGLPYLQSIMFACILEDVITQIRLLDECNNELRIVKTLAEKETLRAKKYQIEPSGDKDSILEVDPKQNPMQHKLDKLAADRVFCRDVMTKTYLELSLDRNYPALSNVTAENQKKYEYFEKLLAEEAKNKLARRELMRQLRAQRNHMKTVTYDTELIIDELKSRVEDAVLNSEIRGRYVTKWQNSRTEQHNQAILDWEKGPSDTIKYFQRRTDQEHRIHSEVEMLVNDFIQDALLQVEQWMTKYDTDMEDIDLKITIMKNKYQNEMDRKIEMEETYAQHEIAMKNWIQFKDDREKAQAYVVKMNTCATIVQAWWRGLLVRLELGPYKPKKGGKPQKGGKKKK